MNNLLNLIQSMSLSASNKRWLADHLYEEVKAEEKPVVRTKTSIKKRKMKIDPRVEMMFQGTSLPEDFDERKAYGDYLYEKYR